MGRPKTNRSIIPLEAIDLHGDGFHLLVGVTLFKKDFTLVLDTGASKTAFDKTLLLAEIDAELVESDKLSTGVGTNSMVSFTLQIEDMHVGDLLIEPFEVAVLDLSAINIAYSELGHPKVLGVLGGDILMKYKAEIDYASKKLTLKTGHHTQQ